MEQRGEVPGSSKEGAETTAGKCAEDEVGFRGPWALLKVLASALQGRNSPIQLSHLANSRLWEGRHFRACALTRYIAWGSSRHQNQVTGPCTRDDGCPHALQFWTR